MRKVICMCFLVFHHTVLAEQTHEKTGIYRLGEVVVSGKTEGVEAT